MTLSLPLLSLQIILYTHSTIKTMIFSRFLSAFLKESLAPLFEKSLAPLFEKSLAKTSHLEFVQGRFV